MLNPGNQPDQNFAAAAKIDRFVSRPHEAFAVSDLTPAYALQAQRVRRGIRVFNNRRDVVVQDEVSCQRPAELWWFMHTPAAVEIDDAARLVRMSQHGKTMYVRLVAPRDVRFTVMDATPLPTSPRGKGQNPNQGIRKLAIHLPQARQATIVVLVSRDQDAEADVVGLDDWR